MILLESKISVPQLPARMVTRRRLQDGMDEALKRKLTLISAPAGSGKTTLLSEWIISRGGNLRVAWLSLGDQENEPSRFWRYFTAALDPLASRGLSKRLNWDSSPTNDDLDELIEKINKEIPNEFVLILDDFHIISAEQIHEALTYLLDYLPSQMHLIIASRTRTPLAVSQLRVRNQLLEFTQAELKFNQDEAESFIKQMVAGEISAEDVAQLNEKTEGWVAGLQLAALSMQSQTGLRNFLSAFSGAHRNVAAYITEQIFTRLPETVRDFLLATSILDWFDAPLCDAVTEKNDSHETLEWLEQNNLFLTLSDCCDVQWYRYHHLFIDFLREKLHRIRPALEPVLHQRAALWLKANSFIETAVEHALRAKDYPLADRLIQQVEAGMWGRNELVTIHRWFEALPAEYINSRPDLCLSIAWKAALSGDLNVMLSYVDRMQEYCKGGATSPQESWRFSVNYFLSHTEILRGYSFIYQGDSQTALKYYKQALKRIPEDDNCRERALALFYLGQALFWVADFAELNKVMPEAAKVARNCGHHSIYVAAVSTLANVCVIQGKLAESVLFYQQCKQYATELDSPVLTGTYFLGLGDICRERNDLKAASEFIEQGVELAESGNMALDLISAYFTNARLEHARGNLEEAQALFHKSYQIANRGNILVSREIASAWQARIWLAQKNMAAVSYWMKSLQMIDIHVPYFVREIQEVVRARILLADGRTRDAQELLASLLVAAESGWRTGVVIEILVLLALAFQEKRTTDKALEHLGRALILAKPEKYVRIFVDEGEPLESLLKVITQREKTYLADASMREYVNLLLGSFDKVGRKSAGQAGKYAQPLIEPLSDRELQILKLISTGRSYDQVAQDLVVALSTVQWHVKNIYQKLNVHSGVEAASVARELNIIP